MHDTSSTCRAEKYCLAGAAVTSSYSEMLLSAKFSKAGHVSPITVRES